jgi:hypothetical protein
VLKVSLLYKERDGLVVMFWELKMTELRIKKGTILRSYSLMLLSEPTPKRIHTK